MTFWLEYSDFKNIILLRIKGCYPTTLYPSYHIGARFVLPVLDFQNVESRLYLEEKSQSYTVL